jgi:acyl carrier protein
MIKEKDFLEKFKAEFLDAENIEFTGGIKFRDLDSWDSLTGMAIQVMIEDNYGVKLSVEKFEAFNIIGEVYEHVLYLKKI